MKRDFLFRMGGSCLVWCSVICAAAFGEEAKIWSDEPIVCHWIGAKYKGTSTYGANASWTDPGNWAEGVVPGRFLYNGETNGCAGCTAVFDRACTYSVIDLDGLVSISNVTVRGSEVPQIEFGKWEWSSPYFILERGGGITVEDDVVHAPVFHGAIRYFKGGEETVTSVTYRNDSSSALTISGFHGPDPAFAGYI